MASGPIISWQVDGETVETMSDFIFGGSQITVDDDCSHEIKRRLLLGRKVMTNLHSIFKSRDITLPTKVRLVKAYGFSSSHVWMWELDCEESWVPKNWCFWTVVLGKTLESALDCKEIQPVHPKGDQSWVFFGRTDAKAETPVLWPSHVNSWLFGKDSDAGRDWGQEKGMTEDEMVGWHHRLNGHEFGWTPGVGDGQRGLACCNSWGCKELDTTERLNWTEMTYLSPSICLPACLYQYLYVQISSRTYPPSILFIDLMQVPKLFSNNQFNSLNPNFTNPLISDPHGDVISFQFTLYSYLGYQGRGPFWC